MRSLTLLIALLIPISANAGVTSLDGEGWHFTLDPLHRGETNGWHKPPEKWNREEAVSGWGWDAVKVPHCWTVDPRHGEHTGTAWYRRSFVPSKPAPGETIWRLTFDAVGERCKVWLNGHYLGAHDSVGIPVIIDATVAVIRPGKQNFLVVAVDNTWDATTIPGARAGAAPKEQFYPWINYGGLIGSVAVESLPVAHIALQKLTAVPTGEDTARLDVTVWPGPGGFGDEAAITVEIFDLAKPATPIATATFPPPRADAKSVSATLALDGVKKWTLTDRQLYESRVTLRSRSGESTEFMHTDTFGIREVRIADARFLLNGNPVYLAGANRAVGHPGLSLPGMDVTYETDLKLMKEAGLIFMRLQHHPLPRRVLDWADRNGMLIIVEYPVWGLNGAELANPQLRERYRAGMTSLMRKDWNHPSVVAWSIGNEYESWTPEGVAWTKDMAAFVREIDTSRPVSFVALGRALREAKNKPERAAHGFDHVDFICSNIYFQPKQIGTLLDPARSLWPEKPVLITEYGLRADRVKNEQERIEHFDQFYAAVRARPWICGFSYWSFNDYPSHYPGTGADGFRRWGMVDEFRKPRPLYDHMKRELQRFDWARLASGEN